MGQVTVLTGARRHREWSSEERLEILREAFSPGAVVSQVARRYDVSRTLIYIWRRAALRRAEAAFVRRAVESPRLSAAERTSLSAQLSSRRLC